MSARSKAMTKHARRLAVFAVVLAPLAWFAPIPTALLLACGVLDVSRHRRVTYQLVEEYFTGKGLLTWLLSPVNLMADALSRSPRRWARLEDLPADCRQEIETCVAAFLGAKLQIMETIGPHIADGRRVMLPFKWFDTAIDPAVSIPVFQQKFRYVKTIAISTFKGREQTSWHFGPQRLTLRVLRNLEPLESPDVFVAVDDRVHRWNAEPLLIFDDTMFHRSVNGVDETRYCLFMDIVRPNHFRPAFEAAIRTMSLAARSYKNVFYKNWAFLR